VRSGNGEKGSGIDGEVDVELPLPTFGEAVSSFEVDRR
jgi:hypothetical protein